jgi:hypothetical protein
MKQIAIEYRGETVWVSLTAAEAEAAQAAVNYPVGAKRDAAYERLIRYGLDRSGFGQGSPSRSAQA